VKHTWPTLRAVADGQYLGADTWLNLLVRRANWAYGQAHARQYLQRQAFGQTTSTLTVWQAETRSRTEHPTLNFSAYIDLYDASDTATLYYYNSGGGWTQVAQDTGATAQWFDGAENKTYDTSGWSLPSDGTIRLKFVITGTGGTSTANIYRAYLSGTTGLTSWPTLPTFADGAGNEPTASDFNALRQASTYLYERAQKPAMFTELARAYHTQTSAYEPLFRWSFVYQGTQNLYTDLTVSEGSGSFHVYVYLDDEKYPSAGSRLNGGAALIDLTADGNDQSSTDLSGLGLTQGTRYQIEVGIDRTGGGDARVTVNDIYLYDLAGVTRSNTPTTFSVDDQPTAVQLNTIKSALDDCKDDSGSESPIWPEHEFATYLLLPPGSGHADADDGGTGISTYRYYDHKVRAYHRWRFLRYAVENGSVKLKDASGTYEKVLGDTSGASTTLDLDDVTWLDYGMEYTIEDDSGHLLFAYEDYDDS